MYISHMMPCIFPSAWTTSVSWVYHPYLVTEGFSLKRRTQPRGKCSETSMRHLSTSHKHISMSYQTEIKHCGIYFLNFPFHYDCWLPLVFLISLDKECRLLFPYQTFLLGTRDMKWSFRSLKYIFKKYIGIFFISSFFSQGSKKKKNPFSQDFQIVLLVTNPADILDCMQVCLLKSFPRYQINLLTHVGWFRFKS